MQYFEQQSEVLEVRENYPELEQKFLAIHMGRSVMNSDCILVERRCIWSSVVGWSGC